MHGVKNDLDYQFYLNYSDFDFSFSCVNGGKRSSQNKENGGSFITIGSFFFYEMVAILLFMYKQYFIIV